MKQAPTLRISEDISWIGVLDSNLLTFDIVMETKYGSTYNSYFIEAEKKTVIETVKETFWPEYKEKLCALTDPAEIEYIVMNHTEPDHSGSLKHLLEMAPNATVVGSGQALNYLNEMIGRPFQSLKVKDGDVLDLGNKKLKVIGAPNLHWPDTIYSYLEEDAMLFTCDSFGAHFSDERMFDDLVGDYSEAFDYYFDVILRPYSKFMLKAIDKIKTLPIDMILPGHGPILRSTWKEKIDRSVKKATAYLNETEKKKRILIAYISAYGYTKEMAEEIAAGLKNESEIECTLLDIEHILLGDLEEHISKADALIVGSPTINQNTLLPVYRMFSVMNPIRDKGKAAAVFGSFGWSGEAIPIIENQLRQLKLKVVSEGVSARFVAGSEENSKLSELGKAVAAALQ
ncbi:MAG: MBL fold metallo-hydrolase [Bacteroidetes bacterium]|nr:MAG: MBL fold metallo-hydrolase [Bacteroidota bacterium]